ncbi:hypothetical protein CA13_69310 [Planctomycetes bacterium CA13]|uniref:DUF5077 domain-containing protein n=1 Tax=Novipirellula herctigrandis TaxID=2527986 RepID=A0A5C5YNM8_9BACT|nr:hypothetical protein CA13_69310 [Planctomycetes bacterium CA13]
MRTAPLTLLLATVLTLAFSVTSAVGNEWSIPVAGNTFRSKPDSGRLPVKSDGNLRFGNANEAYSVFFHVDRPGNISLAVKGRASQGTIDILALVGDERLTTKMNDDPARLYPLGEINASGPGYVQVKLQCAERESSAVTEIDQVVVRSDVDGMTLDYVKTNQGNMFYWGRRGPSVHLSYRIPNDKKLTYAYSEITVPIGYDPTGAYYMANGFGEGYFGFQVNSESERRVLFSVWSPFRTDNPADIPAEDRVITLAKGDGVHAQDFGNEGSGGQSYLVYPWNAGTTYRFLTEVKPDGEGNTLYTSWFGEKTFNRWQLIASFQRPKTDKHLTGFHSFLENFNPNVGHVERKAYYGNQWVCDVKGNWHEITRARLTGDNTARGRHRLDFDGGTENDTLFLRHCGFFDQTAKLDHTFDRDSTAEQQPAIEFDDLPRR